MWQATDPAACMLMWAPRRARKLRLDQHWVMGKSVASNMQGTKDHMIAELFEAVWQLPPPIFASLWSNLLGETGPKHMLLFASGAGSRVCGWGPGERASGVCQALPAAADHQAHYQAAARRMTSTEEHCRTREHDPCVHGEWLRILRPLTECKL
jgi:hypothetical protein